MIQRAGPLASSLSRSAKHSRMHEFSSSRRRRRLVWVRRLIEGKDLEQMRRATEMHRIFAIGLVLTAMCLSEHASAERFAPDFCEFSVDFPANAALAIRDIVPEPGVENAQSAQMVRDNYMVRAQCVRYRTCGIESADDAALSGLVQRVMQLSKFKIHSLRIERGGLGRVWVAEGSETAQNINFMTRIRVYFGDCTRFMLHFGTEDTKKDGLAEWIRIYRSVGRKSFR